MIKQNKKSIIEPEYLKKPFGPNLGDYLPMVLLAGQAVGSPAVGSYADKIGFLVGAMRRKDDMNKM